MEELRKWLKKKKKCQCPSWATWFYVGDSTKTCGFSIFHGLTVHISLYFFFNLPSLYTCSHATVQILLKTAAEHSNILRLRRHLSTWVCSLGLDLMKLVLISKNNLFNLNQNPHKYFSIDSILYFTGKIIKHQHYRIEQSWYSFLTVLMQGACLRYPDW